MEEGKGQGGLATSHQYGNALLGVCYQEEEVHNRYCLHGSLDWLSDFVKLVDCLLQFFTR